MKLTKCIGTVIIRDMTNKEKLLSDVDSLLEIYKKNNPIGSDGSFNPESVKNTVLEMLDFIFTDEAEKTALKEWMESHEFWTSPASTKFHGNTKGGLAAHSLLVAKQALFFAKSFADNFETSKYADKYSFTAGDIVISAIAHDFCKSGSYMTESRRTKDFNGNWTYEPFYKMKSDLRNLGHGNESVLLLIEILPQMVKNRTVIEAISRHMGFSDLSPSETYNYSNFLKNPLVLLLQIADETAAQWWDV